MFAVGKVEALHPAVEIIDGADEIAVDVDLRLARLDLDSSRSGGVVSIPIRWVVLAIKIIGIPAVPAVPAGTLPAAVPTSIERRVVDRIVRTVDDDSTT